MVEGWIFTDPSLVVSGPNPSSEPDRNFGKQLVGRFTGITVLLFVKLCARLFELYVLLSDEDVP